MPFPTNIRALFFDVFGTVVDWRSSITSGLQQAAGTALNSPASSISSAVRMRATSMDSEAWGSFAQEWRNQYGTYTRSRAADPTLSVMTINEHHLASLRELLKKWELEGLWNDEQVVAISLIWHRLVPWVDSAPGLQALSERYLTSTLSNGNLSLLQDLKDFGKLSFTHVCSAEMFGTFKPNKAVYLGAAEKLGVAPQQCALVAAHLPDLKAAKGCGFSTVYVERLREEDWDQGRVEQAKNDGFVDVWISIDQKGFLAVDAALKQSYEQ